ncbi:Retrovirus-related Pol polyprotein from transposon TNT 1-94 [Senna tora]|uniref:Retrovirus-related Pol polyprotein from transposon TNT 1-94 n=1 Tax=Senna tora TaxID=362788 RepID=A0A834W6Y9_9FABA|nr:Retrovirus-related Pol polyprotein from transposon TNT 1-94 [Senna tora]
MLDPLLDTNPMEGSAIAIQGVACTPGNDQKNGRPWCETLPSFSDPKETTNLVVFSKEQVEWLQKLTSQGSSHIVSTGVQQKKDLDKVKTIGNARVKDGLYRVDFLLTNNDLLLEFYKLHQ